MTANKISARNSTPPESKWCQSRSFAKNISAALRRRPVRVDFRGDLWGHRSALSGTDL